MDELNRWRIVGDGVDFTFGDYDTSYPLETQIEITPGEITHQDGPHPDGDGIIFGEDTHGGMTVGFTLAVLPQAAAWRPGLDLHSAFLAAWRDKRLRDRAAKITELRHEGRGRKVYGRPREAAPTLGLVRKGWSGIVADFQAAGETWYAIDPSSVGGSAVPATTGGLVAPLVAPLMSEGPSSRSDYVTHDGDIPTPATVTFKGPCTDPELVLFDLAGVEMWSIRLARSLAFDQTAVIDTRPWSRSALINGTTPCAGKLRGTRMADLVIPPGRFRLEFRCTDGTGTSTYELAWNHAYASL